ncbi:hypothetical protein PUR49_03365 [Streptomyces sp. BE147]|uniref:hypothetical protein n=1 Tax=Streptomyces sp. BE147 TaxID=3002524 RepID=UPI002E770A68|nr:hypothetical protein [Streptomyces sp. BE147]MEE1735571.1 hypothetical protein [Streptomyces sp. BE147]
MGRALQRKKAVHLSPDELWAEAAVNEALETRGFGYDDQAEDGKADLFLDPLGGAGTKPALEVSSLTGSAVRASGRALTSTTGELIHGLQGDRLVELLLARTRRGRPRHWSDFSSTWNRTAWTGSV